MMGLGEGMAPAHGHVLFKPEIVNFYLKEKKREMQRLHMSAKRGLYYLL